MFNQVILLGRLTRDVELRKTPSGKSVASASLVTSKRFKDSNGEIKEQSEFHNLVIWQGADNFANYLHKGSKVQVIGELRTRQWEKDGQKHYSTEIIVNQFIFLDDKKNDERVNNTPSEEQINDFNNEGQEEEIRVENIPF